MNFYPFKFIFFIMYCVLSKDVFFVDDNLNEDLPNESIFKTLISALRAVSEEGAEILLKANSSNIIDEEINIFSPIKIATITKSPPFIEQDSYARVEFLNGSIIIWKNKKYINDEEFFHVSLIKFKQIGSQDSESSIKVMESASIMLKVRRKK